MIRVLGLKEEIYIGEKVESEEGYFVYKPCEMKRFVLMVMQNKERFKIYLENRESECGSGWTIAYYGEMYIEKVKNFGPFTHIPIKDLEINEEIILENNKYIIRDGEHEIQNDVFSYSYNGDDYYYPMGGVSVNMRLFKSLERKMEQRPVWILKGPSGLGKSTLANQIVGLNVYETDSCDKLPDEILSDIIVLGNKYNFSYNDIKKRLLGNPKIIEVDFY